MKKNLLQLQFMKNWETFSEKCLSVPILRENLSGILQHIPYHPWDWYIYTYIYYKNQPFM